MDYLSRFTWKKVTIASGATVSGSIDAVQQAFNGATSGTFRFKFRGQETDALDYDASAAEVKTALEGLAGINTVTVTGTGTSGDPWIITFTDPGSERLEPLGADDGSLSTGAGTTVTVTTPGEGPIDILGYEVIGIITPAALDGVANDITPQIDPGQGQGTFYTPLTNAGAAITWWENVAADEWLQVPQSISPIVGARLRLSLSASEAADREFWVVLKALTGGGD